MPRLERLSDDSLARLKTTIEAEQKKRRFERNGLKVADFDRLHVEPGCQVISVFVKIHKGGGVRHYGISPTEDYETDTYEYYDECTKHKVRSAGYKLLSPVGTG